MFLSLSYLSLISIVQTYSVSQKNTPLKFSDILPK